MSDIFISYASKDRDRAEIIAKALSDYGWTVWWDRTIPAGQTFCTVIEKALAEAKCIMVLWSGHSVSSNWVQEEAEEGRKKAILIPVFIEKVKPPMGFRSFQAADLTDWNGVEKTASYEKLIADITNVIGPPLNLIEEREYKPKKEAENKVEEQEESKKKAEKNFRLPVGKKGSRRHFIWGICAIVLLFVGFTVLHFLKILPNFRNKSNSEARKKIFAIVDVLVYKGHPDKMPALYNDYTGLSDNICTDSYIHAKMGKRLTGYDVNTGIGGDTVTIWVKYEELPITSTKPVLVDIEVKHWPGWKATYPQGRGWKSASGNDGRLTSRTKGGCWRNGLCVKYMPLKDANTIITNVGLAINKDCPSGCNYGGKPIITNLVKSGIDIHKACGDKKTIFVCANHVSPKEIANTVRE